MTALPLSARAAIWASAVLAGRVEVEHARSRAHAGVTDVVGTLPEPGSWPPAGERVVLVALPRPGSFSGMPRAPRLSLAAALDAGECLVAPTVGGLLVPQLRSFGPPGDEGRLLTWTAHPADPIPRHTVEALDLRELGRALAEALLEATSALEAAGGIPWRAWEAHPRPDAQEAILPDGLPARGLALLVQAATVHALALDGLELEQLGPALDAGTSTARSGALRRLLDVADDALVGATNVCAMVLAGWRPA